MALKPGRIKLLAEVQFNPRGKVYDYLIANKDTEKVLAAFWNSNEFINDDGTLEHVVTSYNSMFDAKQNESSLIVKNIRVIEYLGWEIGNSHSATRELDYINPLNLEGKSKRISPDELEEILSPTLRDAHDFYTHSEKLEKATFDEFVSMMFVYKSYDKEYIDGGRFKKNDKKGDNKTMKNLKNKFKIPGMENVGMKIEGAFGMSMLSGKVAVKMGDSYFSYDAETGTLSDESNMVMELPFPGMVLPAQVKDLKPGDVLLISGSLVFVTKVRDSGSKYTVIGSNGVERDINKVSNVMMKDVTFVEKVMNPFEGMNMGGGDASNIFSNPMVMMAMMGDNENSKFGGDSMMEMMMMSQMMSQMGRQ